ncbi:MAG: VCBS repeat-containing protein [Planctomycetes bacterium]|nr:VCBS repeat-containing protein [Planctomycetota bacterium]
MTTRKHIGALRGALLLASAANLTPGLDAQRPAVFHAPFMLQQLRSEIELVGDVDRDGDVDAIAFLSPSRNAIKTQFNVLFNDGSGNLTEGPPIVLAPEAGSHVLYADVDGNGFGDVLISTINRNAQTSQVLIYPGAAGGTFGAPISIPLPGNVGHLRTGNVDNDGIADLFVMNFNGSGSEARWYRGNPQRNFATPYRIGSVPSLLTVAALAIVDTDADGVDDFAVSEGQFVGNGTISLFRTKATGFVSGPTFSTPTGWSDNLLAFDIDGDGDRDLLGTYSGTSGVTAFRLVQGNGGTWSPGRTDALQSGSAGKFYVGDWNGDGRLDLVEREFESGSSQVVYHDNHYYEQLKDGRYVLRFSLIHRGDLLNRSVFSGAGLVDLDRDGALDFVDSRSLFFGDGTFDDPSSNAGPHYRNADWEGDGDIDLIGDTLQRNDGRGHFESLSFGLPNPPTGLLYGSALTFEDLDGDGLRDAVVPLIRPIFPRGSEFVEMRRLAELPGGGFVDVGAAAAAKAQMQNGRLSDADRDGDLDWLDRSGLWRNDGKGFFTLSGPGFGTFVPIAVGDVDGRNGEDFLGSDSGIPALAVFVNDGQGGYTQQLLYRSTYNIVDLANGIFADLDDDGDLDVVGRERLNFSQSQTRLFVNTNGTFTAATTLTQQGLIAAGDINGDLRTDLVISDGALTTVLLRKATGLNYDAPLVFSGGYAQSLVDIDQDGDLDLVGGYGLVRNRSFDGPNAGLRRQYGTPATGLGGYSPVASAIGILRPGQTPDLALRRGRGGAVAVLMIGAREANRSSGAIPGLTLYTEPLLLVPFVLGGTFDKPGAGVANIPVLLPTSTALSTAYIQFFTLDAAGTNGVTSHTNGVELRIGK